MKLMTHFIAGYPTLKASRAIGEALAAAGADILEIQLPFSDPVADGPLIARANAEALSAGATTAGCLAMVRELRQTLTVPIVLMTYFNVVFRFGIERFCRLASLAGASGLILPDFPFDEEAGNGLIGCARRHSLSFIPVVAPNNSSVRLRQVLKQGSGFVYCVARSGITGDKTVIARPVVNYLQSVRRRTRLPLAVGFGLSRNDQIGALKPYADIAVVGSALLKAYQSRSPRYRLKALSDFVRSLSA